MSQHREWQFLFSSGRQASVQHSTCWNLIVRWYILLDIMQEAHTPTTAYYIPFQRQTLKIYMLANSGYVCLFFNRSSPNYVLHNDKQPIAYLFFPFVLYCMNPSLFSGSKLASWGISCDETLGDERWVLPCGNQHHCLDNLHLKAFLWSCLPWPKS